MSLKDVMAADISAVFLNPDEFAEQHVINGQTVCCVIDDDNFTVRSGGEKQQFDGIFLAVKKLFVKAADLPRRPKQGRRLVLDEDPYTVIDCVEQLGMYEITIGLNDS